MEQVLWVVVGVLFVAAFVSAMDWKFAEDQWLAGLDADAGEVEFGVETRKSGFNQVESSC